MKKIVRGFFLPAFALFAVSPVIFLLAGTFMGNQEIIECISPVFMDGGGYAGWRLVPQYPTLGNVVELLLDSPEFFKMFWNSAKITVFILAGQLIFGMPAAWGMARYDFRGKKMIYTFYIVMMMMPFQVTMLSEYLVLDRLHLMDTSAAVILPGIFSTFSVFIMYRFFRGIPESIMDAARIDGAGELQIFVAVGIPLGSSGIISALVLSFLECYSMIEQPMTFLKTKSLWPLSLFLPEVSSSNAGFSMCASFAALLPAVFVFLIGQDYLEQGIAASGIK
ncbi:carbohydrate ABC transporter permease [bacterium 1xD8-6]|nr:carbohydrate ABC transporter permease [bacterium D16-36]RKI68109.1 carbohydrate ABC transporter permease [bacterium 1xD8-6]